MSPEVILTLLEQPYKTIARYFHSDFFKYRNVLYSNTIAVIYKK